jgi:hypothetical protein
LFKFAAEGNVSELNDKTIKDYPVFLLTGTGPHTDYGNMMEYGLTFFYFDRLTSDSSNDTQIYSQGIEALKNLINSLRNDEYILGVSSQIQYIPFVNSEAQVLSDRTCGVYCTINITVPNDTTCYVV